jgi:5'-deoxynucleotidase YfbR-like HD superfamily hydrolase
MSERFKKIRDAGHVRRWHTKRSIHSQTVGEHTFGVVAVILHLWPDSRVNLIKAAMWHDVPEIATGDVPAPTKRRYPELYAALQEAEHDFEEEHDLKVTLTIDERNQLKLADWVELVLFAWEEMQAGNKHFSSAYNNGIKYITALPCNEKDKAQALGLLASLIYPMETPLTPLR